MFRCRIRMKLVASHNEYVLSGRANNRTRASRCSGSVTHTVSMSGCSNRSDTKARAFTRGRPRTWAKATNSARTNSASVVYGQRGKLPRPLCGTVLPYEAGIRGPMCRGASGLLVVVSVGPGKIGIDLLIIDACRTAQVYRTEMMLESFLGCLFRCVGL